MSYLLLYLLFINIIAFVYCYIDKRSARKKRRRVPERALLTVCALGGSPAFLVAMLIFRHKTKHNKFLILVPIFAFIWLFIVTALYSYI